MKRRLQHFPHATSGKSTLDARLVFMVKHEREPDTKVTFEYVPTHSKTHDNKLAGSLGHMRAAMK